MLMLVLGVGCWVLDVGRFDEAPIDNKYKN